MKRDRHKLMVLLPPFACLCLLLCGWGIFSSAVTQEGPGSGAVTCEVQEVFDGSVKSSVTVTNTGSQDAYMRLAIMAYWMNETGQNVQSARLEEYLGKPPWVQGQDGYYYCPQAIVSGNSTPEFLTQPIPAGLEGCPEGCHLEVQILAEAIQAAVSEGDIIPPVRAAWGIGEEDGLLQP